ncbi:SLAM family member 7 isoform X2 [Lemur catta]|uniref:SLAM family member 7 isoform X2 n=1 Tax=Lemur catta TaxID=9447 RepID=UPI001E26D965|nr:SLAM family member 7 isoform X2 [Lemur catta]XP_045402348.1 SLAM family member 7 isoform X2 [Lemur catta]
MADSSMCLVLISLLWQLTGSAAPGALKELVGALGGSVTFPLNVTEKQADSIVWTFNKTSLVTVEPMGDEKVNFIVTQSRNKERMEFLGKGHSLKLSKLMKNDSGAYRVEIHGSFSPSPITEEYVLRVYEHLSKPKVTIGLQSNKNGTCTTNLTCSMANRGEDVTYSWEALEQAANQTVDGSILHVSWRRDEGDMTFICMARNPVSSNFSNPILVRKLCEGVPDSSVVFLHFLLVPILLSPVILGLALLSTRREKGKESTEEKKRTDIHQEIPNFCPHSGETTEYDTVSYNDKTIPKEDPANTLYSTVQIPKKLTLIMHLQYALHTSRSSRSTQGF